MTGVLNAVVGQASAASIVVTIGVAAGTQYGFNSVAAIGSVSPATFKGNTFQVIASDTSYDFSISILGASLPQTLFRSVTVQSTAGTIRTYLASAATFSATSAPDKSQWLWGTGSSKVWTATSPSPRTVLIHY
jgi:succinylarginine dihydrolase